MCWLFSGCEIRFGTEGSQFAEGRHLLPTLGEGGLQPIVSFQSARSVGEGSASGSVARWLTFLSVARVWSLTMSSGIILVVVCVPGYPGCVIKRKSRTGTALLSSVTAVQVVVTV